MCVLHFQQPGTFRGIRSTPRNSCDGIFEKISRDRLSPPLGNPAMEAQTHKRQWKHKTQIGQQEIPTEWNKMAFANIMKLHVE